MNASHYIFYMSACFVSVFNRKDRSSPWKQIRFLYLCVVHHLGSAQPFISRLSHPHGACKAIREITVPILQCNSPRGNSLLSPPFAFSTFLSIIMLLLVRPGKRQVGLTFSFLMIARHCFMHASALTQ